MTQTKTEPKAKTTDTTTDTVTINIALPADLHRLLKHRAIDSDSTMRETVIAAITAWCA